MGTGRGLCREPRNFERVYLHEISGYAGASMTGLVQKRIENPNLMF